MADEIVIGKIGLTPKGDYVPGELYDILDMVSHEGNSYVSKIQNNEADVTNTEAWLLAAKKGDKGDIGDKGDTFTFNDLTTEQKEELKGDVIAYNSLSETDKNDLAARVPVNGTVAEGVQEAVSGGEVHSKTLVKSETLDGLKIKKELIPVTDFEIETRDLANSANSKIDPILSDDTPNRLNSGENTNAPSMFPSSTNTPGLFGIDILDDTESPTASIIGKKRRFFNNITADKAACYRIYQIQLGNERPTKISISFRAKRSELTDIFVGNMQSYLGLGAFAFNLLNVLNGTSYIGTSTPNIPQYSSVKLRAKLIEETNDWCRIELLFHEIAWKETFTGSVIDYYFLFNGGNFFEKTLDVSDWTLLFDEEVQAGVIYGGYNDEFPSNIITLKNLESEIQDLKNKLNSQDYSLRVLKTNTDLYISNPYSSTQELVRRLAINRQSTFSNNPNVNFISEYLISKASSLTSSILSIKNSGDDITPAYLNDSYIGGNHSWAQGCNVVATNHGKTLADVGAVYKNSNDVEFVILRVVDENNIWMISKNQSSDYSYSFISPSGILTYVSNGTNISDVIVGSQTSLGNTYTTVSESAFKILLNNEIEVTENKEYSANNFKIIEEYYALDLPSIIDEIIANRPPNGYTIQPQLNSFNSVKLIKHSIVYEVQENGCMLITTNFRTYNKKVNFSFHGFIQAMALSTGNIYVPKSLPYVAGSKTYNLNLIEDWTTAPTITIGLTPEYWESPTSPPDRVINMNTNTVFHTGYVTDRGVGFNRKDKVNNSMSLNRSRKLYPMGDSIARVMNENTSLNCVAFRDFQNPANNPIGRTSVTQFEIGNEYFVYLDYHNSLIDFIEIPKKYIGCKIEVFEKVGNVDLITDVVNGKIEVQSNVISGNYGFLILKIK